jgi:predicted unusual protein kinase regulating ubiquinone biosynthesis (AarF/ABC1/UbiB family)
VASYSIVKCSCQSLADTTDSPGFHLVIPTLEATTRALRLVRTVVLMVVDYEVAKVAPYFESAKEIHDDQERVYWGSELDRREKLLEEAQMRYANDHLNDDLPARERKEAKVDQKEEMHQAAVALAQAEEHLVKMGGDSPKSQLHRKAAHRLLQLCRDNGGVYIKVGQHLANLDYLVPEEYIDILSKLFDDNPQTKYEDVCRVVEQELGGTVEQIFDKFETEPIASASLAQVHVAYEKETGRKLAVKVQHAGLRETSKGDVFAVTTVVRLIDSLFEDFTFGWIADEIAPHLPQELDFEREGRNSEKAAAHLLKVGLNCVVPKVVWNHTSPRVLTMEFEEGFKANDLDAIEKAGLNKQ